MCDESCRAGKILVERLGRIANENGRETLAIGGAVKGKHHIPQRIAKGPPHVMARNADPESRDITGAIRVWTPREGDVFASTFSIIETRVMPHGRRDGHGHVFNRFDEVDPVDDRLDCAPHALSLDNDELDVIQEAEGVAELIDLSA